MQEGIGLSGRLQDDDLLRQRMVHSLRHQPEVGRRGAGEGENLGEGNKAQLGGAGAQELKGLSDVFSIDDFRAYVLPQAKMHQGFARRPAIGGMARVGHGEMPKAAFAQDGGRVFQRAAVGGEKA